MIDQSLARKLWELEELYRHELLGDEERQELRERIARLKKKLAAAGRLARRARTHYRAGILRGSGPFRCR